MLRRKDRCRRRRGALPSNVRDLEAQKPSLTEELYRQRQLELGGRLQKLRAKAAKRLQQLDEARQATVKKIAEAVQPSIAAVYQRYRCTLLLSRDAVLAGNPGMDVTAEVIKGLGLEQSNLFVDETGHWRIGDYVPAYKPFAVYVLQVR